MSRYWHDQEDDRTCEHCEHHPDDCICGECKECGEKEPDHAEQYPYPCLPGWSYDIWMDRIYFKLWPTMTQEQRQIALDAYYYVAEHHQRLNPGHVASRLEKMREEHQNCYCCGKLLEPVKERQIGTIFDTINKYRCSVCGHEKPYTDFDNPRIQADPPPGVAQ